MAKNKKSKSLQGSIVVENRTREGSILKKYFRELSNIKDLTIEEEVELATKAKGGDQKAMNRLITANLKFVVWYCKKYQYRGLSMIELISAGNVGLIEAAKRFNPTKGFKFITYSAAWLNWSIQLAIYENGRASNLIKLPVNRINDIIHIDKAFERLQQRFHREPTSFEIFDYMNENLEKKVKSKLKNKLHREPTEIEIFDLKSKTFETPKDIEIALKSMKELVSLESPLHNSSEDYSLLDAISSDEFTVQQNLTYTKDDNEVAIEINGILHDILNKQEIMILENYFGLNNKKELTLIAIAKKLHLNQEDAGKYKDNALKKLRTFNKANKLKALVVNFE